MEPLLHLLVLVRPAVGERVATWLDRGPFGVDGGDVASADRALFGAGVEARFKGAAGRVAAVAARAGDEVDRHAAALAPTSSSAHGFGPSCFQYLTAMSRTRNGVSSK